MDHRARVAPGKVVGGAVAERRGISAARRPEPRIARQPGVADPRERPRRLRERAGDEDGRGHKVHGGSSGRQDSAGQGRQRDRAVQRAGAVGRRRRAGARSRDAHAGAGRGGSARDHRARVTSGMNTDSLEDIRRISELAIANDYQMAIHAIGDRGNREALDIYEETFKRHPEKSSAALRWRIEHAQHISAADIPRFGRLGVIASMEGIHCTSDAPYVLARLGPKRAEEGAYVWQKLMKSGATIANGTDAPVEDIDPIPNFYASVSRKLKDGSVFYPDQRLSRMEALRSCTVNGAYAGFEEENRGS